MKKSLRLKPILLVGLLGYWVIGLLGCQSKTLQRNSYVMMGTVVEVISPDGRAAEIACAELKRIEDLLSKYKATSEISRLNKLGVLTASPETIYIMKEAKKFWLATAGAFDVTIGPLADIWGFTEKDCRLPDRPEIKQKLRLIGFDKVSIDEVNRMIKFNLPGMKVDLGAIAKGYAVDCAIKKVKEAGIKSCLINAGGDIYCLGDKFGSPWNVAVQDPRSKSFISYLKLKDQAVATSGDYEQYFLKGKKRYFHIFNPKTGYPADSGVIAVTVIARDCLTADALATSIMVLGKEKGLKLAENFPGVEVKICLK